MRNKKIIALALALVCYFSGSSQTIYSYQNWADGGAFGGRIVLPHDSTTQGSKTPKSDVLFIGWQMYTLGSDGHYHLLTGGGGGSQVQSDYSQTDNSQVDYIKNKPSISAVGLSGQWLDVLNRPIVVRQDSLPYQYPTWLTKISWQTLATSPDSNTYGYHTAGYYWAQFGHVNDSAIWKNDAQYLASHNLTMHDFMQMLSADGSGLADPTQKVIVFMGTSITHGITDTSSDTVGRWTDRVVATLFPYGGFTEMNLGVPGTLLVTQIPNIPLHTSNMVALIAEFGTNELNDDILDTAAFRTQYADFMAGAVTQGWRTDQVFIIGQMGSQFNIVGTEAQQRGFNFVDSTTALQYGSTYIDLYNPLILPQFYYLWNSGVANIHPPIDAVPLFADIVAGALSKKLQYQNMTQQLLVKDTMQVGALVIKNIKFNATPRLLSVDEKGNAGLATQLPAEISTQGGLYLRGALYGLGSQLGLQNSTIPPDMDRTKDWMLPYQGSLIQYAQTAVPYTSTLKVMYSDGNSYYVNNNPHGFFSLTAPAFVFTSDSIIHFAGSTDFSGIINIENQEVEANYGGHSNSFLLSENGTRNTYFKNRAASGVTTFMVSLGIDAYEAPALTLFPSGSLTIAKTLDGDVTSEEPSSQLTVGDGPSGVYHDRGSIPNVRMTTTQRDAIASPADGLHIYNITTEQDEYYNGTTASWIAVGASGSTMPFSVITTTGTASTASFGSAIPSIGSITGGNTTRVNGVRGGWGFTSGTGTGTGSNVLTITIPTQPGTDYVVILQQTAGPFTYVVPTTQTTTSFHVDLGSGASAILPSTSYAWNYWIIN